jgi:hypothetical protein
MLRMEVKYMKEIIDLIPNSVCVIVGLISLSMAFKNIFSDKFLPFHEIAVGKQLDEIDAQLQFVIIALMRVSGLGFLILSVLLIILPIYYYFNHDIFLQYFTPGVALLYCTGLFIINYSLYKKVNSETPWEKTLIVILLLIVSIIISVLN